MERAKARAVPPQSFDLADLVDERMGLLGIRLTAAAPHCRLGEKKDAFEKRIADHQTELNNARTLVHGLGLAAKTIVDALRAYMKSNGMSTGVIEARTALVQHRLGSVFLGSTMA